MFVECCPHCVTSTPAHKKPKIVKPILSEEFSERGQVDLIDMRNNVDGDYKFIGVYQDHYTKFCVLFACQDKTGVTVASHLLTDVFSVLGAPRLISLLSFVDLFFSFICLLFGFDFFKIVFLFVHFRTLQSDNGSEFVNQVVSALSEMWGVFKIEGRPYHPQSQGSVERLNGIVQRMIGAWIHTAQSNGLPHNWAIGIKVVQYKLNTR